MNLSTLWWRHTTAVRFWPLLAFIWFLAAVPFGYDDWHVETQMAAYHGNSIAALVAPLCAGCVVFDCWRLRNSGISDLVRASQRRLPPQLGAAVATYLTACVLWLIATGLNTMASVLHGNALVVDPQIVFDGPAALLAAVALGLALGSLWPALLAVPLAAVGFYGLLLAPKEWGISNMVMPVVAPDLSLTYFEPWTEPIAFAQAVLCALAAAALACSCFTQRRRHRVRLKSASAGLAVMVMLPAWLPFLPTTVDMRLHTHLEMRCVGQKPTVCHPKGREVISADFQRRLAEVRPRMEELGLTMADTYAQSNYPYTHNGKPAGVVRAAHGDDGKLSGQDVARTLTSPVPKEHCSQPLSNAERSELFSWLLARVLNFDIRDVVSDDRGRALYAKTWCAEHRREAPA